jgi:hypothetical protein
MSLVRGLQLHLYSGIAFYFLVSKISPQMEKIYYRGQPYDFEIVELMNDHLFVLYKDAELAYYVKEEELDCRSRVSIILEKYYSAAKPALTSGCSI